MSSHHIDRLFKDSLGEGTMPVHEGMWQRLEPFLPEPRKRDRGVFLWLAGIGVVLLAALLLWITQGKALPNAPINSDSAAIPAISLDKNIAAIDDDVEQPPSSGQTVVIAPEENSEKQIKALEGVDMVAGVNSRKWSPGVSVARSVDKSFDVPVSEVNTGSALMLSSGDDVAEQKTVTGMNETRVMRPFLMLATPVALSENTRALPDPAKDCYDFGGTKRNGDGGWFVEAYTGPTLSMKKLSSKGEDVSGYILGRDTSETNRMSWNAGLRVGYVTQGGISARLGAHYTVVNEKFGYYNGMYSMTVIDTIFDGSGNIIDIDTNYVTGQRIKTTHNHYHTVDIPLLIGYQVSRNNWTYGIQAGPMFNILFRKKGDILSPTTNEPVSFSDKDDNPYPAFKDRLGVSIYAGGHIGKRIGYRTTIYAEPHLQMRLKSITQDGYPVEQKQTNVGLSVGLRYTLN